VRLLFSLKITHHGARGFKYPDVLRTSMDKLERANVLEVISDIQQNTSSVTVQIGGVADNNQVEHGSLYIQNAPPKIIDELSQMGYSLAVSEDGVRVRKL